MNDIGVVERDGLRVDSEYLEAIAHNIQCSLDRPSSTRAKSRNVAHWAALMTVSSLPLNPEPWTLNLEP